MFEILSIIGTITCICIAISYGAPIGVVILVTLGLAVPLVCSLGALFSKG